MSMSGSGAGRRGAERAAGDAVGCGRRSEHAAPPTSGARLDLADDAPLGAAWVPLDYRTAMADEARACVRRARDVAEEAARG